MRTTSLLLVTTFAVACGAPPKDTGTARDVSVKPIASSAPIVSTPSTSHGPSKAVLAAFTLEKADVVVYADLGGLLHTKLVAEVTSALLPLVAKEIGPAQRRCVEAMAEASRELAVGITDGRGFGVLTIEPGKEKGIADCIELTNADATKMPGADAAWRADRDVLAIKSGLVVVGLEAEVAKALAGGGDGSAIARLSLDKDEWLAFAADVPREEVRAKGRLLASGERLRVAIEADIGEKHATDVEQSWNDEVTTHRNGGEERRAFERLGRVSTLRRDGGHLSFVFDLQESAEDQASDVAMAATIALAAVKQTIGIPKNVEAKYSLGQIAKDVVTYWEREDPPGSPKKKLVSCPPVPATVPRGNRVQTKAADWKGWAPYRFSMYSAQRYQYEVKAAKDGKSAEILARGDLNGDGKTSLFRLQVKVKPDGHVWIAPTIDETDPFE